MAKMKSIVAEMVKRGKSFKGILSQAKEDEATKWEIIKVFLWWCWFKSVRALSKPIGLLRYCGAVSILVVSVVLFLVLFGAAALLSPIWYPIMMIVAPKSAANLLALSFEPKKNGTFRDDYCNVFKLIAELVCIIMGFFWGWTWRFMPMKRRQYYLDATGKELKGLSVAEQHEYYRLNPSSETVRKMSFAAVEELRLQYASVSDVRNITADIKNIGDVYEIYEELGKTMFNGDEEMFELLKGYCANEKKRITASFLGFLIEKLLKGEGGEAWSRASSLLLLCSENRTFADHQLKMLFASLGRPKPVGLEAWLMLESYFSRHSFTDNVISLVISLATDVTVDECREKNFELLCKIARRDGLSTELAEEFFTKCNSVQNERMTDILKIRMDCEKVGCSYDNDENRMSWQQYCSLKKDISVDAQLRMKEWQYDIFHKTLHELSAEVIYELLVKRLSEKDMSYFEKVLDEEQVRETLSENALKLILMTPWKRDIVLTRLEASQKIGGLVL